MWLALVLAVATRLLTLDPSSEVILDKVELRLLVDGSRALHLVGSSAETKAQERFFFVADPAAGTYRTYTYARQPADNPELKRFMAVNAKRLRSEARRTKERGRGRAARRGRENETELPGDEFCPCDYICSGYGNVTLTTWDPAFIRLTATAASSAWSRNEGPIGGCVWRVNAHGTCWANPLTPWPLSTHWYVVGCGQDGPRRSDGYAEFAKFGSYMNWDFGDDSAPTGVDQGARLGVRPLSGSFYDASHYDWGEAEFLIYGSLDLSFENSCF
jgi:hypothetical protein